MLKKPRWIFRYSCMLLELHYIYIWVQNNYNWNIKFIQIYILTVMISWYFTSVLTRLRSYTEGTIISTVGPYIVRYTMTEMTGITMKMRIRFWGPSVRFELETELSVPTGDSDDFLRRPVLSSAPRSRFFAISFAFRLTTELRSSCLGSIWLFYYFALLLLMYYTICPSFETYFIIFFFFKCGPNFIGFFSLLFYRLLSLYFVFEWFVFRYQSLII